MIGDMAESEQRRIERGFSDHGRSADKGISTTGPTRTPPLSFTATTVRTPTATQVRTQHAHERGEA